MNYFIFGNSFNFLFVSLEMSLSPAAEMSLSPAALLDQYKKLWTDGRWGKNHMSIMKKCWLWEVKVERLDETTVSCETLQALEQELKELLLESLEHRAEADDSAGVDDSADADAKAGVDDSAGDSAGASADVDADAGAGADVDA